jgi:AcrR family transcriptional regulator
VAVQRATEAQLLPRGRHGLLPGAVVENQRQRLIRAVPGVVRDKGFAGMTVEDLAGRAGVSRKTFYENFHDKRDCFLAAYRQSAQELAAVVASAAAASAEWPEQVSSALAALLRFFAAHPDVAYMGVIEVMAAGPEALAERDAAVAGFAALLGDEPLAAAREAPRLPGMRRSLAPSWAASTRPSTTGSRPGRPSACRSSAGTCTTARWSRFLGHSKAFAVSHSASASL